MKYYFLLITLFIFISTGCDKNSTEPDDPDPGLRFSPSEISSSTGEQFEISLNLSDVSEPFFGVSLRITFDESMIGYNDQAGMQKGDLFGDDAIVFAALQDSVIHISLTQIQGDTEITGSGTLGTLTFSAYSSGEGVINLTEEFLHFYDQYGDEIQMSIAVIDSALVHIP
ncbi:MAG: cohesin domain-containing protein [Candidatus Electryonea clarkiae]|nr:cohesin domain-containing protein [Candidatus Electryonea clarkiae]MDP8288342.1 cohesin domain-containing protein [Candidatus Electryonea clarkiae]